MQQDRTILTGKERRFSPDEFIVSKTDAKGIITYANDVFLRIADYTLEEVIGKPHTALAQASDTLRNEISTESGECGLALM